MTRMTLHSLLAATLAPALLTLLTLLTLASAAALAEPNEQEPTKEAAVANTATTMPELVKVVAQLDKGDFHGSYGCLEIKSGFAPGVTVGGAAHDLLVDDRGGHHSPNGVDTFKIEVQYPASVAKGTQVTFTISGVELVTSAGTTVPSPFPGPKAGGIKWIVKGPGNLGGTVVDNSDGTYTVTALVDDHTAWSGSANQIAIACTISDTTVDVKAYTAFAKF